ncbi:selenoprotein M-like [Melitaea cinxia]|uniref:selenoprotein M-like n=1 Tax=Melitaea cinxia TaxID=113334 RepID=UPI001E272112|nr:selenoprotein M-like [Melitaea cinxia]
MSNIMKVLFITTCVLASSFAYDKEKIVSARIETCRGCSLNRLPEVKKFVMEDAPFYDRVEVKFITGAPPEVILLDAADQELERIALSNLNREECNKVLGDNGFAKKGNKEEF